MKRKDALSLIQKVLVIDDYHHRFLAEEILTALEKSGMSPPVVLRHGFTCTAALEMWEEDITEKDWSRAFDRARSEE